jgi:hypothetical protein
MFDALGFWISYYRSQALKRAFLRTSILIRIVSDILQATKCFYGICVLQMQLFVYSNIGELASFKSECYLTTNC